VRRGDSRGRGGAGLRRPHHLRQSWEKSELEGLRPAQGGFYVWLTNDESKQMRRLGLTVIRAGGSSFLGTRAREGAGNPSCVALRGRVGGPCRCAIYRSRPLNCRQFEVGGSWCKAAREQAGLPV
jgi:Fe-S-cluster containining protein